MNNQIRYALVLIFCINISMYSQNVKKIFKNIKEDNIEEAINELKKVNSSQKYDAEEVTLFQLGNCLILSNEKSASFKPYEADKIFKSISFSSPSEINKFLDKYDLSIFTIYDKILDGILVDAKKINTESSYESALNTCRPCKYESELVKLKSNTAYSESVKKGTLDSYKYFISNYNNSEHINEVTELLNQKAFDEAKSIKTVQSMNDFISNYSHSKQINDAVETRDSLVFSSMEKKYANLLNFTKQYPKSKYTSKLIQELPDILYMEAITTNTIESLNKFITDYPHDLRVGEIKKKLEIEHYKLLKNSFSNEGFAYFQTTFPNSKYLSELKSLGESKENLLGDAKTIEKTDTNPVPCLMKDGNKMFVDAVTFKPISGIKYDDLEIYSEGLAAAKKNGKWGFIDKKEKVVIPFIYNVVGRFENGSATVSLKKNNKGLLYCGYINKTGKIVVPIDFAGTRDLYKNGGLLLGNKSYEKKDWWLINLIDMRTIPISSYDSHKDPSEGLVGVKKGDKWGFINKNRIEVLPFIYDDLFPFNEGLAQVKLNKKWVFIDKTGNKVIGEATGGWGGEFHDGLAHLERNGKWGCIDKAGNTIIEFNYDGGIGRFGDGFAIASKDKKDGVIDKKGKEIVPFDYHHIWSFSEGFALVSNNDGKNSLIDITGKLIVDYSKYDTANLLINGFAEVYSHKNKRKALVDKKGKEVVSSCYSINIVNKELMRIEESLSSGKWFYVNKNGVVYREK